MLLLSHFRACARNNMWCNDRLLRACAQLSREELHARRVSFFPSIILTLNHILTVDWYYRDALENAGRGLRVFDVELPFPEIDALASAQRESDRALVSFCDALNEAELGRSVATDRGDEGVFEEALSAVLAHLFLHQTHHRGQAHAMLAGTRVAPPQLDEFFLRYDEPRRREEVARLGI